MNPGEGDHEDLSSGWEINRDAEHPTDQGDIN